MAPEKTNNPDVAIAVLTERVDNLNKNVTRLYEVVLTERKDAKEFRKETRQDRKTEKATNAAEISAIKQEQKVTKTHFSWMKWLGGVGGGSLGLERIWHWIWG